jgi:signal peptidase I
LTGPAAPSESGAMESDPPAGETPAAADAAAADAPAKKDSWWDTLRFLFFVFLFAVVIRTFVAAPFSIPSGSMVPRLLVGDYLFVAKWPYGYSRYSMPFGLAGFSGRFLGGVPARGDVVVFHYPGGGNEDWVKRVIGLPGDLIEVRGGEVILNGRAIQRTRIGDYLMPVSANSPCRQVEGSRAREVVGDDGARLCAYPRYRETLPGGRSYDILDQNPFGANDNRPPVRVPEGHVFVMGDNRDDSEDSRVPLAEGGVGMLPIDNLLGRVLVTFFSTDGSAEWLKPRTWFTAARGSRIGSTS